MLNDLTWQCDGCGSERPDAAISVYKSDEGARRGLKPGIMIRNWKYCNDRPNCLEKVQIRAGERRDALSGQGPQEPPKQGK